MNTSKKLLLAYALSEERDRLPDFNSFGESNNKEWHKDAIDYLVLGIKPDDWEDNDLLVAIIEDFDTICKDYEI